MNPLKQLLWVFNFIVQVQMIQISTLYSWYNLLIESKKKEEFFSDKIMNVNIMDDLEMLWFFYEPVVSFV